jgi:uncharacterized membrane protein (DUF4010 family)
MAVIIRITRDSDPAENERDKERPPEPPLALPAAIMVLLITFFCTTACLQMWDKGAKNPYVLCALLSPLAVAVFAIAFSLAGPARKSARPAPERRPVRAAIALLFALACAALCAFSAVTIDWNQAAGGNNWKLAGALWCAGLVIIAVALLNSSLTWYQGPPQSERRRKRV